MEKKTKHLWHHSIPLPTQSLLSPCVIFAVEKVKSDALLADETICNVNAFFFAQLIHKLPYLPPQIENNNHPNPVKNTKLRGYEILKEPKKDNKIYKDAVKVKCPFNQWWWRDKHVDFVNMLSCG